MRSIGLFAIAAVLLSASLSACGKADGIRCEATDDELTILCDEAELHEVEHIGSVPVGENEVLCIEGFVQRGSVEVVFRRGARKITATLEPGPLTETVACDGGVWSIDVESTGDRTKGDVEVFKRAV